MKSSFQGIVRYLTRMWQQICSLVLLARMHVHYQLSAIGQPAEFLYVIRGQSFFVRKNTSDVFALLEVWMGHAYLDPPPGGTVVDLGANIGAYTVLAARSARCVFAFEPLASSYRQLQKNTCSLKNVTTLPFAVAGSEGVRTLSFDPVHLGRATIIGGQGTLRQEVPTITLSRLFELCGIQRIDLLKMDIEGAEYEVLLATPPEILQRIGAITMEVHDALPSRHHASLVALLETTSFAVTYRADHYWLNRVGYLEATRSGKGPTSAVTGRGRIDHDPDSQVTPLAPQRR